MNLSQREELLGTDDEIMDCKKYSTKLRLLRVTTTVQRCARIWRHDHRVLKNTELTAKDLKQAERMYIEAVKEKAFPDELQYLRVSKKSPR